MPSSAIRLALVNDYEIVIAGLSAALIPYADRITLVEMDSNRFPEAEVDVVLYDTFGQLQGDQMELVEVGQHGQAKVIVFSWNLDEGLIERAIDSGVAGYVAKATPVEDLVTAIEAVAAGESVVVRPQGPDAVESFGRWPGEEHGLSNRESEVLALITQGLTNQEICERTYLSLNTLKSYIRNLYQKIRVDSRAQAVLWGFEHGFRPDHSRRRLAP